MPIQQPYTEARGAQQVIIFGCTLKSISAEYGDNNKITTCTIVLVQEIGQEFQLASDAAPNDGVEALAAFVLGDFIFSGIVTEWTKQIVGQNNKNVFTVKMADAKHILQNAKITLNMNPLANTYAPPGAYATPLTPEEKEGLTSIPPDVQEAIDQGTSFGGETNATLKMSIFLGWTAGGPYPNKRSSGWNRDWNTAQKGVVAASIIERIEYIDKHSAFWYEEDMKTPIPDRENTRPQTPLPIRPWPQSKLLWGPELLTEYLDWKENQIDVNQYGLDLSGCNTLPQDMYPGLNYMKHPIYLEPKELSPGGQWYFPNGVMV